MENYNRRNEDIDLRTFIVKFIAFHIKYLKWFVVGTVIALIISVFIITTPQRQTYQYHLIFSKGDIPTDLVSTAITNFKYDNKTTKELGKFNIIVINQKPKSQSIEVLVTSGKKLDIKKFISELSNYANNSELIKSYVDIALKQKENYLKQLKEIKNKYKEIKDLKVKDKGVIYATLYRKQIELQISIDNLPISKISVSNYYSLPVKGGKGKKIVYSIGVFILIFAFIYIIIFFIENKAEIKKEIGEIDNNKTE